MMTSIYKINKGINQPIEFKGLKAQYIWYLGAGVVVLLIFFAVLYLFGIPNMICAAVVGVAAFGWISLVYKMSRDYGQHGLMKVFAWHCLPKAIHARSRRPFFTDGLKIK
ncbi:DUF4133 domain-containing protein [Sphingobacterium corticis]|uniref:DUF4133 domain-containing protein n=1 Tax=Sphingobacterium corticis TaxID=1812823 RepID=A0ABW5NIV6_9SPHI